MSHYNTLLKEYYDNLLSGEDGAESEIDARPLFAIDYNNEKQLTDWLVKTLDALQTEAGPRTENQFRNILFYKGIHTLKENTNIAAVDYDNSTITSENRFVMNHILEFTLQKQSKLMRFSPTINVFPWNNSYADRLGSRLGKKIIDSAFYTQNFEGDLSNVTLEAGICGESYLFFEWDEFAGDKTKEHIKAEVRKEAVEQAKDEEVIKSLKFMNEQGALIDLNTIPRVGDHKIESPLPWQVLHELKTRWKDVNYVFKCTIKHIDEVRAENAHLGDAVIKKIQKGSDASGQDASAFSPWANQVVQWEFYHRFTRFVPKGKYAKFYNGILIKHGDLPYSHGELPCARFTDYDDPVSAHGRSFYESLKLPSVMINNMMKVAYRSFVLAAYPKIIMQQDSVNMYSMANGPFVMEYNPGAREPKIVSFTATNGDFFPLSDHVERFMEKNSGTFGISRGDQVPNARARSILNFYEEQEQERESSQIRKFNAFIEKAAKQILANSSDFYKPDDGRTIRVVGKNNQYKLAKMNENTKLSSNANVKIERTTALSESKQGRIDQINTLSSIPIAGQEGTGLFTREQILSMIEVADTATFFEMSAAPAEAASSENEDMFEGIAVPAPADYQSHLVHWNVHYQWIQSREFTDTEGVPEEVKNATLDHLRTHEMMLYEKAKHNLTLAMALSQNTYFPAVYKLAEGDLPLSQIIMLLNQPPMPPQPPAGPQEGGGSTTPPQANDLPPSDVPSPDSLPTADGAPMGDPMASPDGLPLE